MSRYYKFIDANGTPDVLQVDNYYPFGMRFGQANTFSAGGKTTQYMYNGKELQEDFNLDWYDYGARMYDAALGRWHVMDNLTEVSFNWTPYRYAYNNPIIVIDNDGNIERNAITGKIIVDYEARDIITYLGTGQVDYEVRGHFGYITANDGLTKLPVIQVNQVQGNLESHKTNCSGFAIADGEFHIVTNSFREIANFLKADGFYRLDEDVASKVGDIGMIVLAGTMVAHMIKATGVNENGEIIWTSAWPQGKPNHGTLDEILKISYDVTGLEGERDLTKFMRVRSGQTDKMVRPGFVAPLNKISPIQPSNIGEGIIWLKNTSSEYRTEDDRL